jgi:hypothetical protein
MTLAWACRDLSNLCLDVQDFVGLCKTSGFDRCKSLLKFIHILFGCFFRGFFRCLPFCTEHGTQSQVQRASGQVQYQGLGWSWGPRLPSCSLSAFPVCTFFRQRRRAASYCTRQQLWWFRPLDFGKQCSLVICAGCYFYILLSEHQRPSMTSRHHTTMAFRQSSGGRPCC